MDIIWYIFDMIGTIAFAVSGALVGVSRKMDIFGMTVLALATAIGGGIVMLIIEIIVLYAVVCAALLLVQGTRKIPVQYAKRVVGNKQYGGARQYIPLKLFAAKCNAYYLCASIDVYSVGNRSVFI